MELLIRVGKEDDKVRVDKAIMKVVSASDTRVKSCSDLVSEIIIITIKREKYETLVQQMKELINNRDQALH